MQHEIIYTSKAAKFIVKSVPAMNCSKTTGTKGGSWNFCTHMKSMEKLGPFFNVGLANFIVKYLSPTSLLEFGCGIGLYVDYMSRFAPKIKTAIGIEPENMAAGGVFAQGKWLGHVEPIQLAMDVALVPDDVLQSLGEFDVVLSIEVLEHIPVKYHTRIIEFLVNKTKKFLVFSAAPPKQNGIGHIPEAMKLKSHWISIFSEKGLVHLPEMSTLLSLSCDKIYWYHKKNIFVMGRPAIVNDTEYKYLPIERTKRDINKLFFHIQNNLKKNVI